jgi:uncharacterized membrane protein YeaQ/YmgE (transglycosylase-associated protein family)
VVYYFLYYWKAMETENKSGDIMEDNDELVHKDVWYGALLFGAVIGWVTATTMQHLTQHGISDIAAVAAAVGGAAISKVFSKSPRAFGVYGIGLAAGFFGYLFLVWIVSVAFSNIHK